MNKTERRKDGSEIVEFDTTFSKKVRELSHLAACQIPTRVLKFELEQRRDEQ